MAEPFLRIVDKDSNTEVLRITATEIVVDPNLSVDDAARRVIEALQVYFILAAEEQASCIRAEALEEAARICEERGHAEAERCAADIRALISKATAQADAKGEK